MKKIRLAFISLIVIALFAVPVKAQSDTVAFCDTVSNSQSKTFTVDVEPTTDSVKISLYAYGEIDLDSLDVKFKRVDNFRHNGREADWVNFTDSTWTQYSKTLTVNLDSGVTSYSVNVTTIPRTGGFDGFNEIQFIVTSASSGNTVTDPLQKLVAIIRKY